MNIANEPIDTLSDLIKLLKSAEGREKGIHRSQLRANGIASLEVAATALRARGYQIRLDSSYMFLEEVPAIGARRRKKLQTKLFEEEKSIDSYAS